MIYFNNKVDVKVLIRAEYMLSNCRRGLYSIDWILFQVGYAKDLVIEITSTQQKYFFLKIF